MLNRSQASSRFYVAILCAALAALCAQGVMAQSGRRVRKSTPASVSTPEPTPTPTPNASSEKPKPRLTFLVGLDGSDGSANIPLYAYEGVLRSLADRLAKAPGIQVGATQSEMSHIDAIQKAKAEKEGYVVWIQLQVDTLSRSTGNSGNLDNIVIEYTVLAPTTAKVATSGRAYPQRNKGIILGPGTSGISGDRYLNRAAQEAADRILAHFRLHMPPNKQP
jgi:hypothetical protein